MNSSTKGPVAPLSPILIFGLATHPVPHKLLQPIITAALNQMHKQHPEIFERMKSVNSPRFLIDPVDLPFSFVLDTCANCPTLKIVPSEQNEMELSIQAIIRGPLVKFFELLEGRIDGDALFFSRDLVIEGDTECVVALRNATDGADINILDDLLRFFGPMVKPIELAVHATKSIFQRFSRDLAALNDATLAPLQRRYDAQAVSINELEQTVTTLKKQISKKLGRTT